MNNQGTSVRSMMVSIVVHQDAPCLGPCLESLTAQSGFTLGDNLSVVVRDNGSSNQGYIPALPGIAWRRNERNLGFCRAHNQTVAEFLASFEDYLLVLNPDVALGPLCLQKLVESLESEPGRGLATPKLLRSDAELRPLSPPVIDAAGMELSLTLRHFDRGAGRSDRGEFEQDQEIFGGTGACLLLKRSCVEQLLLRGELYDSDVELVYPEYRGSIPGAPLFDEAFFAYREDADLCWRAQLFNWRCRYVASAHGFHLRTLPETSRAVSPLINALSVRNRFLLQLNNYSPSRFPQAILPGLVIRNLIVIAGVLFTEWRSLPALLQLRHLTRRALERRRTLFQRVTESTEGIVGQTAEREQRAA